MPAEAILGAQVWIPYRRNVCVFSNARSVMQLLLFLVLWREVQMCRQKSLTSFAENRKCSKTDSCLGLPWNAIACEDQQIKWIQFHSNWFWRPFTFGPVVKKLTMLLSYHSITSVMERSNWAINKKMLRLDLGWVFPSLEPK